MIRLTAILCAIWGNLAHAETLKLAVTTSFHNSGLSDLLLPVIRGDTGIDEQLLVVVTAQALRLGAAGDVDAILVHSRAAEEDFISAGHGTHRREIMYNDFVVIGPGHDPAGIADAPTATVALTLIAQAQVDFVSRGDDSGTHKKETSLWIEAGQTPGDFGGWYKQVGAGMGASLNTASSLNAYILADRASWLNFGNKGDLALLFSGDPVLFNQYAYLPVNPAQHPHVQSDTAQHLEEWLVGPTAKAIINGYTIGTETLFVHNAQ